IWARDWANCMISHVSDSICKEHKESTKRNGTSCSGWFVVVRPRWKKRCSTLARASLPRNREHLSVACYATHGTGRRTRSFRLTRLFASDQFSQIAHGRVNLLQIPPSSLFRFRIDLAHERDHIAEIADAGPGEIALVRLFVGPGGDFVYLRLQPAQVGTAGSAQRLAQTNEVTQQ